MPDPTPDMRLVPTFLKMSGWSQSKVYELIAKGELEAYKVGRATMILGSSFDAYRERHRFKPRRNARLSIRDAYLRSIEESGKEAQPEDGKRQKT